MAQQFDPVLIIYQMVAMQCLYYAFFGLTVGMLRSLWGFDLSPDALFSPYATSLATTEGCLGILSTAVCAPIGALLLVIVVERTKKCLDFTATLHIFHFLATAAYSHVPTSWDWWATAGGSFLGMVLLGECLCSRRELQDIPILSV